MIYRLMMNCLISAHLRSLNHLYMQDSQVYCKKTSPWYTQVQMQMFLSKCDWCDLAVYTNVAPFVTAIRIPYDGDWWSKQLPVLEKFFLTLLWPRLGQ
jgi:hypothetical protein